MTEREERKYDTAIGMQKRKLIKIEMVEELKQ